MLFQKLRSTGWLATLVACGVCALHFSLILYAGYATGMLVNDRPEYSPRNTKLLLAAVFFIQVLITVAHISAMKAWWLSRSASSSLE